MSEPADRTPTPAAAGPEPSAQTAGDGVDAQARAAAAGTSQPLHVCPACSSPLVAPVAWAPAGPRLWAITLECPNCAWWSDGVFDEEDVERFDEELDRGTEALVHDLLRLTRANMEDDVERFIAALQAGAIVPEDF